MFLFTVFCESTFLNYEIEVILQYMYMYLLSTVLIFLKAALIFAKGKGRVFDK